MRFERSGRVAFAGLLLCLIWQSVVVYGSRGGDWTALFYCGERFPPPPPLRQVTYQHPKSGYDGQFYRYIAHDPFLQRGFASHFDDARLRYRRILLPFAAWLLGLGQRAWIDTALLALVFASVSVGVWFLAKQAEAFGRSAVWGLAFLAVPASIASIDRALVDGALCAAVAGFVWFSGRQRTMPMLVCCLLAGLIRETGVLLAVAGCLEQALAGRVRKAMLFALTAAPAFAWALYIAQQTPESRAAGILSRPVWGLIARLLTPRSSTPPVVQAVDILAILGLMACIALAIRWALPQWRSAPAILALLFAGLGLALGAESHLLDPFGFARPVSPLLLWVGLEALRREAHWAMLAPAAVSLAVLPTPAWTFLKALGGLASTVIP